MSERDKPPRPGPAPVSSKVPSSTYYRFEHIAEQVRLLIDRVRGLEDRQRQLELEGREGKGEARSLRDLLDRVHRELVDLESQIKANGKRLEGIAIEQAKLDGERRHGALVATGGGAAGGGLLYALVELVKKVLE